MEKRHIKNREIYKEQGIYIENGNIWRRNTQEMRINIETKHIQRGDINRVETYKKKRYRTYTEKDQMK